MIDFFDRLDKFMIHKGLNDNKITVEAGISNGLIGKARKRGSLSQDNISKLLSAYPELDANWLFTGTGEMLKDNTDEGKRKEFLLKTDKRTDIQSIPLYSFQASAGLVSLFTSSPNVIDYITIPNLPKCDGAISIVGDSMYPLLKAGDIIIYKQVYNITESIFWGEMYILSYSFNGDDMTTVKYVQKSDLGDDYVKLVSQNSHHHPKDIRISCITALALVKASIRINSMT